MTDLRTAAHQALEALENLGMRYYENTGEVLHRDVYEALKSALVEPVQEPDPWGAGYEAGYAAGMKEVQAEPVQKPLAEWQINDLMSDIDPEDRDSWSFRQGVYAAEKHHGVRR